MIIELNQSLPNSGGLTYNSCPIPSCDYSHIINPCDELYIGGLVIGQPNNNHTLSITPRILVVGGNVKAIQDALNALNIGIFEVTYNSATNQVTIKSLQNTNQLLGINYYEHLTNNEPKRFLSFGKCNCTEPPPDCSVDLETCNYTVPICDSGDGKDNWQVSISGIQFVGQAQPTYFSRPFKLYEDKAILTALNSLPQANNNNFGYTQNYLNNTANILLSNSQWELKYIVASISYKDENGIVQTIKKNYDAVKSGCSTKCCQSCGGEGQYPCNFNGNPTCINGLKIYACDGKCYKPVGEGYILQAGLPVKAGGLGMPTYCNGTCNDDFVPKAGYCWDKARPKMICDYTYTIDADPKSLFTGIVLGDFGTRNIKESDHLPFSDGQDILSWLNSEEAGICPTNAPCFALTNYEINPNSDGLNHYEYTILGVSFGDYYEQKNQHTAILYKSRACCTNCELQCVIQECKPIELEQFCSNPFEEYDAYFNVCLPIPTDEDECPDAGTVTEDTDNKKIEIRSGRFGKKLGQVKDKSKLATGTVKIKYDNVIREAIKDVSSDTQKVNNIKKILENKFGAGKYDIESYIINKLVKQGRLPKSYYRYYNNILI